MNRTPPRCVLKPPVNRHIASLAENFGELSIQSPIPCPSSHLVQDPLIGEFSALNAEIDNSLSTSSQLHNSTPQSPSPRGEPEKTFVEVDSDPETAPRLNTVKIYRASERIRMKCKQGTCTHQSCKPIPSDPSQRLLHAAPWAGFWSK